MENIKLWNEYQMDWDGPSRVVITYINGDKVEVCRVNAETSQDFLVLPIDEFLQLIY